MAPTPVRAALPSMLLILNGCGDLAVRDTPSLLVPSLRYAELVGFVAGLGTTFAAMPDLVTMVKQRSSAGMHPRMAAILCVFQLVWLYYGLLIASWPLIVWNTIAVVVNALTVGAYVHFVRRERRGSGADSTRSRM
jgi:MtN3 and saliva related transmembrane protein